MASTSLGTLTLDLAVRLSEFTDGLTRAERETQDSTEDMSKSVTKFKDQLIEDLSGTPIGGAIDSLNERLSSITEAFGEDGVAGAAKIGAAGIIGATVGIAAGLTAMAIQVAETDGQLQVLANRANVTTTQFQVLSAAVSDYGIDNEGLSDILADVQEKLGEFSATGAGGLLDTLELLQNNTKMSAEEVEAFGVSLSNVDGVTAIQMVKDKLEDVNAGAQITRFTMESLASGLSDISEVWEDGGSTIAEYEEALNSAGVIRTEEAIEQSEILRNQIEDTQRKFQGLSNQLVTHTTPALNSVIGYFIEGTEKGKGFRTEVSNIGTAVKYTASLIVGMAAGVSIIATAFQTVGAQMRMIGQTYTAFESADGMLAKSQALAAGFVGVAGVTSVGISSVTSEYERMMRVFDKIENPSIASTMDSSNSALESLNRNTIISTKTADDNAKALDAQSKALEKRATALKKAQKVAGTVKLEPNKLALQNAQNYGFANYEAQYGLPQGLMTGIHMQESHGNTQAKGPVTKYGRAKGGFQLIDATAERFKVDNALNMEQATEGAAKYLSWLYNRFNGDLTKTIAAYNTGEGNIDKNPMSLILSDRWARDKKTGIGQTKQYTQNVLAYMKSATTDTSKLVYDTVSKQAQDAQKLQEETLRKQASVAGKWAYEKEKIELTYQKDVAEVKAAHAEGSADYIKYMARVEEGYTKAKNAGLMSIMDKYMGEEQRIHDAHKKAMGVIDKQFAENDPNRQLYVDLQKAAYAEDLDNFKFAAGAKARERYKLYKSIADSARAGSITALSTGKDSMMQRTLGGEDYSNWRLNQDYVEGFDSVNNDYKNRKAEINYIDERGKEAFPEIERFELLEIAKQEHLDKMWALEQEYALKDQTLAEQQTSQKIAMYQSLFSGIAGLTKAFAGEQSTAYRIMFGIEQGFAIAQAAMAIQQSIAKAMTIGYPQNIPIIAETVGQGAQIVSSIKNITMGGIAHGGLDYVPKEATYLLDEGERVLSPRQNKDLANFMSNGGSGGETKVIVNNYSNEKADVQTTPDGDTIVTIGKMINQVVDTKISKFERDLYRHGRPFYGMK